MVLCSCSGMSRELGIGYGATAHRYRASVWCYGMSGTELAYSTMCYGKSSTELAYGPITDQ
eukprot:3747429-Rhodomonas_salina.1